MPSAAAARGDPADRLGAGGRPAKPALAGEPVDGRAKAAQLRLELAQTPGERPAAVHRRMAVATGELVDERLLRAVEIDQHAAERQRDGHHRAAPFPHESRPYIV